MRLAEMVRKFEEGMMVRAQEKAEETWKNLKMMMCEDAPGSFVKRMEELMAAWSQPP